MADPDLVHRAEQAYLGALLVRQGRVGTGAVVAGDAGPDAFAGLRPLDFTDPVHQAIYAALAEQATSRPGLAASLYAWLRGLPARLQGVRARDAGAYMAGLPGLCPDPANLAAYAAMVTEASQQRAALAPAPVPGPAAPMPAAVPRPGSGPGRAAAENPRLASAGEWLEGGSRRHRPVGNRQAALAADAPASRTAGDLPPDVARLARALRSDARSATHQGPQEPAQAALTQRSQGAPLDAEALQEQVLAGLMRRPADGRDVASWLPDTVFTAGPNRSLYQLISVRLADGRPVDPLIIAWDASVHASVHPDLGGTAGTSGTVTGEPLAAAALRLGALDPGPGAAAIFGRALYAEQVCSDAFGLGWPRELARIPIPTPAAMPDQTPAVTPDLAPAATPDPSRRPEPAPSTAGQAVASATGRPGPSAAPPAEAEAASRARTEPDAARHPMPALPRRGSSPPLQQPPVAPRPAGPAPAQRM